MSKVSAIEALLRRLLPEDRARLNAILNEEPRLEDVLSEQGAEYLVDTSKTPRTRFSLSSEDDPYEFTRPSPIAMMEPERFRSLAATDIELEKHGVDGPAWSRAKGIAGDIRADGGLNFTPFLQVAKYAQDKPEWLPRIFGHEGRGRSMALQGMGLRKIPVSIEVESPSRHGLNSVSDRIEWLRKYNKLLPEVEESGLQRLPVDISDVKLFAKGGKVRALSEWIASLGDSIKGLGMSQAISPDHLKHYDDLVKRLRFDPKLSDSDFDFMKEHEMYGGTHLGDAADNEWMNRLVAEHGVELPRDVDLYRGLALPDEPQGIFKGRTLASEGHKPVYTTTSPDVAFEYATESNLGDFPTILAGSPEGLKGFPRLMSNHNEIALPSDTRFVASGRPRKWDYDEYEEEGEPLTILGKYRPGAKPKYAKGGKAAKPKKKRSNVLDLLAKAVALPNPILMPGASPRDKQLFARGLLSQWYGLNSEGDPEFLGGSEWDKWPGLVDEVIAMPTLLPDEYVPAASTRAADRLEKLNARMHEDMGIAPASGFRENLIDAAGTMAGQIPTGGAKVVEGAAARAPGLLRKAGSGVKNMGEWFTPTVEATPANYITGTLTGGALNTAAEDVPDRGVNVTSKYNSGGSVSGDLARMKGRYAGGGGANTALRAINQAISAIESGDRSKAAEVLRPHKGNSAVAEVLKTLGDQEE